AAQGRVHLRLRDGHAQRQADCGIRRRPWRGSAIAPASPFKGAADKNPVYRRPRAEERRLGFSAPLVLNRTTARGLGPARLSVWEGTGLMVLGRGTSGAL